MNLKLFALSALLLVAVVSGCNRKSSATVANLPTAFDQAPAEVKEVWNKVLDADKANDYLTAQNLIGDLRRRELAPDMAEALNQESTKLNQRMFDAAAKGDAAAQKAIDELRTTSANRPRR